MRNDVPSITTTNTDAPSGRRILPGLGRLTSRSGLVATGLAVGALIGGGGYALAASSSPTIHGCVNNKSHTLTVQKRCSRGTKALTWAQRGPQGPKGATGATGPQGPAGGTNAVVDSGLISANSGSVAYGSGLTNGLHSGTGSYTITATGCNVAGGIPSVSVLGGTTSPVVVANSTTGVSSMVGSKFNDTINVHLTETATSNGSTLTSLTNPVAYDDTFFLTVTC